MNFAKSFIHKISCRLLVLWLNLKIIQRTFSNGSSNENCVKFWPYSLIYVLLASRLPLFLCTKWYGMTMTYEYRIWCPRSIIDYQSNAIHPWVSTILYVWYCSLLTQYFAIIKHVGKKTQLSIWNLPNVCFNFCSSSVNMLAKQTAGHSADPGQTQNNKK